GRGTTARQPRRGRTLDRVEGLERPSGPSAQSAPDLLGRGVRASGEDHALLALASRDGARGGELPLDAERGREAPPDLVAAHGKGRAGPAVAKGKEAGEEP